MRPCALHPIFSLAFTLAVVLACISPVAGQPPRPAPAAASLTPDSRAALESSLRSSLQERQQHLLDVKTRLVQEKEELVRLRQAAADLEAALAAHQAALAGGNLPLAKTLELSEEYRQRREKLSEALKKRENELAALAKTQQQAAASLAELPPEAAPARKPGPAAAAGDRLAALTKNYRQVSAAHLDQLTRLHDLMGSAVQELQRQRDLVAEMAAALELYREKTFKADLLKRQEGASLADDLRALLDESLRLPDRIMAWTQGGIRSGALGDFLRAQAAPLTGLGLFLILLLLVARYLRRVLRQVLLPWSDKAVSFTLKTLLALARIILKNLWLLSLTLWAGLSLSALQLWETKAAVIAFYALTAWTALRLARALCLALFNPPDPPRAIVPVDALTARFYYRYLSLFFAFVAFSTWGLETLRQLQYPGNVLLVTHFCYVLGILLGIAWLLRKPHLENLLAGLGLPPGSRRGTLMKILRPLVLLLLGVDLVSHLLGFQYFALFLTSAAAYTTLVAVGFWLLAQMVVDVNNYLNHPDTGALARHCDLAPDTLQRTYALFPRCCQSVLLVAFFLIALTFWGVRPQWLFAVFAFLDTGLVLGPLKLSPLTLLLAVGSILLCRRLARFVNFLLARRLYERRGWDVGIQYTISTTVTYSLITLGIILAMGFLGLNLTNLALVAGALGVGIGFGLQNIVNNFVSGLILLFERPIKVGDMLVIDGQWGLVKTIRVRSTIFETFDRYVLIIPNSDLIANKIMNWTHYGRGPSRLTLKVGVAYGSDIHAVTRIIDRVCRANKRVLPEPPPQVFFQAYGDSSLDFNIWVHVRRPDDRVPATHELNTAIYEALQDARIEIPFPQRDLHIRTMPPWPPAPGTDSSPPA